MSARIEPDGRTMMILSLGLVAVLAVASFTLSFLGLVQAAAWAGIPEQLRWLVPIVVDATILVYAVAASVQRARGESTTLSWVAVGFFTAVSVAANAAHVLAPGGVFTELSGTVVFGAFLASIMPISLFFATETTVKLAVAPVYGSVAQRRRRAAKKLALVGEADRLTKQGRMSNGPRRDRERTDAIGPCTARSGTTPRKHGHVDPHAIRELAEKDKLSQRAIASRLGISKTTVARVLASVQEPSREGRNQTTPWSRMMGTVRGEAQPRVVDHMLLRKEAAGNEGLPPTTASRSRPKADMPVVSQANARIETRSNTQGVSNSKVPTSY